GQTAADLALIGMEQAWDAQPGAGGASPVKVAVIDSGVETVHPDLSGALSLSDSWNFVDGDASVSDDLGHGTRVAGIIGATNGNGFGIAGVAFGCKIISLDVTSSQGAITAADTASAVNWAVAHGAQVINMSLRFDADSRTLREACEAAAAAGVALVAAAGNEGQGDKAVYPASYPCVLGVGAVQDDGVTHAPWSNFNGLWGQGYNPLAQASSRASSPRKIVDLVAPGATVFSTIPGGQFNGTYGTGTSFASPMVAGVIALLKAKYPEQSLQAIERHILNHCKKSSQFQPNDGQGAGMLDAGAALNAPMVPDVAVVSVTVDDAKAYNAANDTDGALDKGETARLIVTLTSREADALDTTVTLSTLDPDIGPISHSTAFFPAILNGGSASNASDPFSTITILSTAGVKRVAFNLAIATAGGYVASLDFDLPIENELPISGVKIGQTFTSATTYHVTGNLSLRGATTIMPGALFKVDPGMDIKADTGCDLTAVGAAEAPIRFTAAKLSGGFGARMGLSDPNNIGPKNETVNVASYQQIRYVSVSTGTDTPAAGAPSSPWRSIQYALDQITDASASKKYALFVAKGTYTGTGSTVVWMKEYVDLYGGFQTSDWSRDIAAHVSAIDGESARQGAVGANNARLDGFTVTRGLAKDSSNGGGVYCNSASTMITNCIITGNLASNYPNSGGGGVNCCGGSPSIKNCMITGNEAFAYGGGVYCANSSPFIANCAIIGNRGGGIGAAVFIALVAPPRSRTAPSPVIRRTLKVAEFLATAPPPQL
ncbi:MAG: S8 family serine peptidase, partial [Candidatus Sumerlaeota bacterium]|nr:S8 family serine peptidase [Candidatus Sumerlaeota bacterium]